MCRRIDKMRLLKLENAAQIDAAETIVCIGRGDRLLREFCERYDLTDRVKVMLNDNSREQHPVMMGDHEIPVRDFAWMRELLRMEGPRHIFVITDEYYWEIFDSIRDLTCEEHDTDESRKGDFPTIYYYVSLIDETEHSYREEYRDSRLENIIVFRSGPHPSQYVHGTDFADNSRALFEYMLSAGFNKKYELVWLVKDPTEYRQYANAENVSFLSYEWGWKGTKDQVDAYYRIMCLAKWIFFTDAYGFARNCRTDQTRVQLWHGCGFKTRVNFTRCEHRYECMPVISPLYKEIHKRIYGLRDDQVIVTGYPKDDWLFHPIEASFAELFGAPLASKYIFWMPTFRETESELNNLNEYEYGEQTGLPIVDTFEKLDAFNERLIELDVALIIKLHPFQRRDRISCDGRSNICLIENEDLDERGIPVNRLLGIADALISDYSSAAVDYLLLDRPIGFALEDKERYADSRGFVFDPLSDYLPGAEIYDFEDMLGFVSEISDGTDATREKRQNIRTLMHTYTDDRSSERLVKALGI